MRAAAQLMLATLGNAALAAELPDGLQHCATENDDRRRLACYDAEIARLRGSSPDAAARVAAPSASAPASAAAAGAATTAEKATVAEKRGTVDAPEEADVDAEDNFGRRSDLRKEKRIEASEVASSVAAFSRGGDGRFVVTLENGQIWREIAPNEAVRLQMGDTVRIERGSLGSFLLVAPNKRSTKVSRIK
jgi:hypothetical protein